MNLLIFAIFKNYLAYYWNIVLLIACVVAAIVKGQNSEVVTASVGWQEAAPATLAISKLPFHHASWNRLTDLQFEGCSELSAQTKIRQTELTAWYKICFKKIPQAVTLDFFQYETVDGYEANGRALPMHIAESGDNTPLHRRHLSFDFPISETALICYFKAFAQKWQAKDSLQLNLQPSEQFYRQTEHEFFQNQSIAFWLMFAFGLAFFQLFFIGSLAWSRRKKEYIYYWLFLFTGVIYVYIARRFELGAAGDWQNWLTSSIVVYMALMTFFYSRFVRHYLDSARRFPFLDLQCRKTEWFLLAGTIVNLTIYAATQDLEYTYAFFQTFTTVGIGVDVYLLILIYMQPSPLVKYLMLGVAFLVIATASRLIYNYLLSLGWVGEARDIDAYGSVTGSILDGVCLNLGLNYKHRLDVLEKQHAVEKVRKRISADLHDDLGSGLSTIQLLGANAQYGEGSEEKRKQLQKIIFLATEMINDMSDIIWATDPKKDMVSQVIHHFRRYAFDYLEETHALDLTFPLPDLDEAVLSKNIPGEMRRHLKMCFKEALHNIVKHSGATRAEILIICAGLKMEIRISDNGKGFIAGEGAGNGLHNMRDRMEKIGGEFHIFSNSPGTTVILNFYLPEE